VGIGNFLNLESSDPYLGFLYENGLEKDCGEVLGEFALFAAEIFAGDFDGFRVPEVDGAVAATKVNCEYADVPDGVRWLLTAFLQSYSLIHNSSKLLSLGAGVGDRFALSKPSISLDVSRSLRSLKPVALPVLLEVVGAQPVPHFWIMFDIFG
jgi:hypothetical protein